MWTPPINESDELTQLIHDSESITNHAKTTLHWSPRSSMDFLHNFFFFILLDDRNANPASDALRLELLGEDSSRSKVIDELLLMRGTCMKIREQHWLINYIDTKAKYRRLKNLHVKGLRGCGRCLSEFLDWDTVSHVGIFSTKLCELLPSHLFNSSPLPPFPLSITVYTDRRCWEGGVESCWRPYSARV
jgi:hypothetical protein